MKVDINSEFGLLKGVLLHRPGIEIERMTPLNAANALYSDILNKPIVDREYGTFSGVLERWTQVFYVSDLLAELLLDNALKERIVRQSCKQEGCDFLADELLDKDNSTLAHLLIEGVPYVKGKHPVSYEKERYVLKPLYNIFFTRDASSTLFDSVLINSMSFDVRQRETIIFKSIFENCFGARTFNAMEWDALARTEGGDVQIARNDLLCVGNGIRTNRRGADFLAHTFAKSREQFYIIIQELPQQPESFIHLDMVFTFLGPHSCMAFEPMLKKQGLFSDKHTWLLSIEDGNVKSVEYNNILQALDAIGFQLQPVICGGADEWNQLREQWHSGANFFALGPDKVIGYSRNYNTIDALDRAGYSILPAEDICSGKVDMHQYDKFVAAFPASELPRGGGGARCMTMPIARENV